MLVDVLSNLYLFEDKKNLENQKQLGDFLNISGSITEVSFVSKGYELKENQTLSTTIPNNNKGLALSFWLYPSLRKQTKTISNIFDTKQSLFKIEDASSVPLVNFYEVSEFNNGTNRIVIEDNFEENIIETNSYLPNVVHHFYVLFDSILNILRIYVDGELQGESQENSIDININDDSYTFKINDRQDIETDKVYNNGILKEIACFSKGIINRGYSSEQSFIKSLISEGILVFADIIYDGEVDQSIAAVFDSPTTIKVVSVVDNLGYIYVIRNDGVVLKGSSLIWDVRYNFEKKNIETILNISEEGVDFGDGILQLTNGIVRL